MVYNKIIYGSFASGLLLLLGIYVFHNNEASCGTSPTTKYEAVSPEAVEYYKAQIDGRKELLKQVSKENNFNILVNALVPEVYCKDLVRIGHVGDKAKWICNPFKIGTFPNCTIYSLTLTENPSLQDDLQNLLNNTCKFRTVEKKKPETKAPGRIGKFIKGLIGSKVKLVNERSSLKDLMSQNNDTRIDLLTIDVGDYEVSTFSGISGFEICQILIEVHSQPAKTILNLLEKFSKSGYYLFSYGTSGSQHNISEYNFIHEKCFDTFDVTVYGKYLS